MVKKDDNIKKHVSDVENAWDSFWEDRDHEGDSSDQSQGIFNRLFRYLVYLEQEYNLDRWMKEVILNELPKNGNLRILEAGCGEGTTAINIWKPHYSIIAFDISENALKRALVKSKDKNTELVPARGSLFDLPFRENSFDVVLSIGILEHFLNSEQKEQYAELARVTKKGGRIITLVPSHYAFFYRLGMWYAKRKGLWKFGYEKPLKTLDHIIVKQDNVSEIKNFSGAFLTQFYYLMFFIRKLKFLKMLFLVVVAVSNKLFWVVNHFKIGGYFKISVAEKI